jgi:hypothetical protein
MEPDTDNTRYRDRKTILVLIGIALLLIGLAAAFLGPVEIYCFYLFSEGGRFHYHGFGFGSFMFANIACQVVCYYLLAVVFIPLGYGHVMLRRWARPFSISLLWFWLVVGAPLTLVFLFMLLSVKDYAPGVAIAVIVIAGLAYPMVPGLLIPFYRSRNVRLTFERSDRKIAWIEKTPMPILVLGGLFVLYTIILHVAILLNGVVPFFGVLLSGVQGIDVLALLIVCLAGLLWGVLGRKRWAWWGALAYLLCLTVSCVVTFARVSYSEFLVTLDLPPTELEILERLPFESWHFLAFLGVPLLITVGVLLRSKHHFSSSGRSVLESEGR